MEEEELKKWSSVFIEELKEAYEESGQRSSGQLAESFESVIKKTSTGYLVDILANKYIGVLEQGRRAGGVPSAEVFINWIKTKPSFSTLSNKEIKSFAFAIRTKIRNEGIKVPNQYNKGNIYNKVIETAFDNVDNTLNSITEEHTKNMSNYINNIKWL